MKFHYFKFSENDIDVISSALNNRIQYLKGLLLTQNNMNSDRTQKIKDELYKAQLLQIKTTYKNQSEEYKSEVKFI